MIPNRLLLRAATVLALTRGGDGPFPTMAGEAVFDSKIRPVTDIAQESMTPVALVYTADEKRTNVASGGSGRAVWQRKVNLVIEIAIGSVSNSGVSWIETDAELEAMLDLFEAEVETALHDPTNPWALAWHRLVRCVETWDSEPFRSSEQAARYAVRQIAIEVALNQDCLPTPTIDTVTATGSGRRLLVPYLEALEDQILESPVFASTRDLINGSRDFVTLPPLRKVAIRTEQAATTRTDIIDMEKTS
jgi:hypothetical protein